MALPPLAAAATGDWRVRATAADTAKARSSLIRAGDLWSSYRADPTSRAQGPSLRCRDYAPNVSEVTLTGEARRSFHAGESAVGSIVWVFRSQRDAEKAWNEIVTRTYVRCLAQSLTKNLQRGWTARILEARRVAFSSVASRSAAFRIVIRYSGPRGSIVAYSEIARVGVGRANAFVWLDTMGHACDCEMLEGLSNRVASRMNAALRT